ncbi:MAG: fibronectin type III domain-containing protein [Minicystis sp.]
MTIVKRVRPILGIRRKSTASVLGRAHAVINGMAADPARYAAPNPPLAMLEGQIKKVEDAEKLTATRVRGAASARDAEREVLAAMLETECSYVQTLCDATPSLAKAITENAGMLVALVPVRAVPILDAKNAAQSGAIDLFANASIVAGKPGKKTFFSWQWTTDGGVTFHDAEPTAIARTTITGLAPLTTVGFRVAASDRKGRGPWSQVVSILVR